MSPAHDSENVATAGLRRPLVHDRSNIPPAKQPLKQPRSKGVARRNIRRPFSNKSPNLELTISTAPCHSNQSSFVIVQNPVDLADSPVSAPPSSYFLSTGPPRLEDPSPALTDFSIPSSSLHMGSLLCPSSQTSPIASSPSSLPPLPTLSQPLFPPPAESSRLSPNFGVPSVSHPNSPYVPWDSPRRKEIMRPGASSSQMSGRTSYSRPYSRSGACAPEPTEVDQPQCSSFPMVGAFRRFTQSMKRNVSRTIRRLGGISKALSTHRKSQEEDRVIPPLYSESENSDLASPLPHFARSERFSTTSSDTSYSNSLAVWLSSHQHQRTESESIRQGMTLDEYERRGSWLISRNGICGDPGCSVHSAHSPNTPSTDYSTVIHDPHILRLMRLDTSSRSSRVSSLRRRRSGSPGSLRLTRVRSSSLHGPATRVPSSLGMDNDTETILESPPHSP